jgi:hypothetical protein
MLQSMREAETQHGGSAPLIVHSDLTVVDDALRVVHPSFWRYSRLFDHSAPRRPARMMLQNFVTGCATIGNAALRQASLPIPREARMHDWWLALVAASLGRIVEHEAPTILYRQHQGNEIGAKAGRVFWIAFRMIRTRGEMFREVQTGIGKSQEQAAAFAKAYKDVVDPQLLAVLVEFSELRDRSLWRRKSFLFRYRLWPNYWLHGLALWWVL